MRGLCRRTRAIHPFGWFTRVVPPYRVVRLSALDSRFYRRPVTTPDADNLGELIADCSAIPPALRTAHPIALPAPRPADWAVNDTCLAAVHELDEYV